MSSKSLLKSLLAIPSPTYKETEKANFIDHWLGEHLPELSRTRKGNNIIAQSDMNQGTTIGFVGHIDTVPAFFEPYEDGDLLHGSGASDMQAGLSSMLWFIKENKSQLLKKYNIVFLIYDKEEGTPIHENGLYELIQNNTSLIKSIDLAIVGEPTNNAIQLGCVGSIHFTLKVMGKAAHSARPWHGKNALYEAIPIIQKIANISPKKQSIYGVDFFDVLEITESQSTPGRTTIPECWQANINYRFSPTHRLDEAMAYVKDVLNSTGVPHELDCLNAVDAGSVIEHPLLDKLTETFCIEAKQAWTDVAQLTSLGVCAFNFGPGRQDQAHHPNECVSIGDMLHYESLLYDMLLEDQK